MKKIYWILLVVILVIFIMVYFWLRVLNFETIKEKPLIFYDNFYLSDEEMILWRDNKVNNEEGSINKDLVIESEKLDEVIKQIDDNFIEIYTCKNCEIVEKALVEKSTEGGNVAIYLREGELQKIVKKVYGEMGKKIYGFYYKKGELFLVSLKSYKYNRPIYWDKEKVAEENLVNDEAFDINKSEILEDRFYFANDKLILWVDNDGNEIKDGKEFIEKDEDLLDMNDKTLNLYYK